MCTGVGVGLESLLQRVVARDLNYGREQIERYIALGTPPRKALDIGVGDGFDLLTVKRLCPEAELLGLDFRQEKLEAAARLGISPFRVDLEEERFPFADESVDLVVANQVFEHLKNYFWCLHECLRVLTVGGSFIVGVPNLASLHNRLLLLLGRQPTSIRVLSAHVRGFTRQEFAQAALTVASGSLVLVDSCGANFYPLPRRAARLAARLLPSCAVSSFYLFRKHAPYTAGYLRQMEGSKLESDFKGLG